MLFLGTVITMLPLQARLTFLLLFCLYISVVFTIFQPLVIHGEQYRPIFRKQFPRSLRRSRQYTGRKGRRQPMGSSEETLLSAFVQSSVSNVSAQRRRWFCVQLLIVYMYITISTSFSIDYHKRELSIPRSICLQRLSLKDFTYKQCHFAKQPVS